jgi:hypothetical protein
MTIARQPVMRGDKPLQSKSARGTSRPAATGRASTAPTTRPSTCACGGGCPRCGGLPAEVRDTLDTPGHPLDEATRVDMQQRFRASGIETAQRRPRAPLSADTGISHPEDAAEREADDIATAVASQTPSAAGAPADDDGPDFRDVRVHTDARAAQSARALSANAYAYGGHIVFDQGRFDPATSAGRRLLAHELTHILQPRAATTIHRDANAQAPQGTVSMTVSLDGIRFEVGGYGLKQGASSPQVMALILRRLLGAQYQPGQEEAILADLEKAGISGSGLLIKSNTISEKNITGFVSIDPIAARILIGILDAKGFKLELTDAQRDLLMNALYVQNAWEKLQPFFPPWYTLWLFRREMSQHGKQLADYRAAFDQNRAQKTQQSADVMGLMLDNIEAALSPDAQLVDIIRNDTALATEISKPTNDILEKKNRESCSTAYALLFNVKLAPDLKLDSAPETVNQVIVADLLRYMRTQRKLSDKCWNGSDESHRARVELLGRFGRFWVRGRSGGGDEKILQKPALANTPAWDAVLSSAPPLMPPLYAAALETDHAFTMQLQWKHFTDAMARYSYMYEFIRVPDSALTDPAKAPDLSRAAGEKPSFGNVADARLARTRRYNAADVARIQQELGDGALGTSAKTLAEANNALRSVGTVIKLVLDKATEPRYVARYVFPGAGLYVVRCRALPVLDGDEELVRMPSVAFLPVVARDPDEMAIGQVKDATKTQFDARLRIAEIQAMFQSPFPPENAEELRQEMQDLQMFLLAPQESAQKRKSDLEAQIATIEKRMGLRDRIAEIEAKPEGERDAAALAGLRRELAAIGGADGNNHDDGRTLSSLKDQRDNAGKILDSHASRTKNETGTRFSPNVSFVSDLGHSLQLSIEMYDRGESDGAYQVFMSDLTTPDSGEALGTAPPDKGNPLLETSSDYGRGRVAVEVDGKIHVIPITAGTGRMLSEAVESATMVASLAAIVAAPFTEGASLYLLLPLGAVGAVPSAYRLYQRYEESRLRLDMAAVMDVVNIVGGVIGLAQVATPLRAVRLGKVLMIMGIGMDGAGILLMGAGVAMQLDALQSLPEHERAARMLEILGGAMLQIGIQAGGAVMHARYQGHRTASATGEANKGAGVDEPGFHAPPKENLPADRIPVPAPGDRTMAGSPPSDGGGGLPMTPPKAAPKPAAKSPGAATAAPKGSPEHLFDKLGQGIDRSLPPPLPEAAIKKPAKAGEFRRGLTNADAAYAAYNQALLVSNGREVAIYHHPDTGEYVVMVGHETGVGAPKGEGWIALLHYHPNKENTLTFRLPAPQDFNGLLMRYLAEGVMVREFLEFDIPGVGRGRTEFGIDPANPEPYYVRIHQPDGSTRTVRFANDGRYRAYWGDRTIVVSTDSPVYAAMIRDIEAYLRSIGADKRGDFGPPEKVPATVESGGGGKQVPAEAGGDKAVVPPPPGDRTPDTSSSSPQSKTMAGSGPAASAGGPLQTGMGDLTDAGVKFIRDRFKTTTDAGSNKKIAISSLTDAEIRSKFPNQPSWLEALVLSEARTDWLGRSTGTDFLMSNPKQDFKMIAKRLAKAVSENSTGHAMFEAVLDWSVSDFVQEWLRQGDPDFTAAYNACENNTDPAFRRRWNEFKNSPNQGDMSGFFLGKVGSKRPDMVEVMLSQDEIHINDVSFAYQDPIHNFKSAFYKKVMEHLINVKTVTSSDYRAPLRQTPM